MEIRPIANKQSNLNRVIFEENFKRPLEASELQPCGMMPSDVQSSTLKAVFTVASLGGKKSHLQPPPEARAYEQPIPTWSGMRFAEV